MAYALKSDGSVMRAGSGVLTSLALSLGVIGLLAGCASGGARSEGGRFALGGERDRFNHADPSKVIAAELAFARAAQEKGQWTSFADYSTDEAVMFVPEAVNAHDWLRRQTNPAQAVKWQPHQVWSSCDGSLGVTKGAWQRPDGSVGYFTTVWERQRNGKYKWVLDQGDALAEPLAAPELIDAKVAECTRPDSPWPRRERERFMPASIRPALCKGANCNGGGASADGTLTYAYAVTAQGRRFTVEMRENGAMTEVLRSDVSAE